MHVAARSWRCGVCTGSLAVEEWRLARREGLRLGGPQTSFLLNVFVTTLPVPFAVRHIIMSGVVVTRMSGLCLWGLQQTLFSSLHCIQSIDDSTGTCSISSRNSDSTLRMTTSVTGTPVFSTFIHLLFFWKGGEGVVTPFTRLHACYLRVYPRNPGSNH